MQADARATALFVLGPRQGFDLAMSQGWAALLIIRDSEGFVQITTPEFQRWLDGSDPDNSVR